MARECKQKTSEEMPSKAPYMVQALVRRLENPIWQFSYHESDTYMMRKSEVLQKIILPYLSVVRKTNRPSTLVIADYQVYIVDNNVVMRDVGPVHSWQTRLYSDRLLVSTIEDFHRAVVETLVSLAKEEK
ncbi:non-virion protein [Carpione rhabdovirus]|nr:non-virion protein [Carpione rhabdovirus]